MNSEEMVVRDELIGERRGKSLSLRFNEHQAANKKENQENGNFPVNLLMLP